ncbi:MAG: hypothetical protein AAB620_01680 [Patescibacteria group bacterium]
MKQLSKGQRKHIRNEKSRIRRGVLSVKDKAQAVNKLYELVDKRGLRS